MTQAERHIIETYSGIFDRLSSISKLELLEKLARSIRKETQTKEKDFFKSFGAFESEKSAEDIIKDIKKSRNFRDKDLKL